MLYRIRERPYDNTSPIIPLSWFKIEIINLIQLNVVVYVGYKSDACDVTVFFIDLRIDCEKKNCQEFRV